MIMNNDYLYFFAGPLSTWHKANYTLGGLTFNSIEQYMSYQKALLLNSNDIAQQILKTSDPRQQKTLGQAVKGFDRVWWEDNCLQLAFRCNHAKFDQNKRLYDMLMNTMPNFLVNVSEFDKVWGVGLDEKTAYKTPESEWPGKNWLGKTLTNLRDHFTEEEEIVQEELDNQA